MKAGGRAVIAIGCALAMAGVVGAWVPTGGALRPDGPVVISVALAETAPAGSSGDLNAAAVEAMNVWNAKLQRVRLTAVPREGEAWYENGRSELFFDQKMFDKEWPGGVLAVTATTEDRGVVVETDVVFNAGQRWAVYRGAVQGATADLRRVAVHELGHLLGLDHPDEAGQTVAAIMNSTVSVTEVPTADDETGVRGLYDFGPGAAPVILAESGPVSVKQGESVLLGVQAAGRGPLSYEWRRNGAAVPGATRDRFKFVAGLGDAGDYTVVVRSPAGSATSRTAKVTVQPAVPPFVTAQTPQTSVVMGGSLTLQGFVKSGDGPLRIEWKKDGVTIPNATATQLELQEMQFSDGGRYTFAVSNPAGRAEAEILPITVTPTVQPRFTRDLVSRTVNAGEAFVLDAFATSGTDVTYQWKRNGVALPGEIGPRLVFSGFNATAVGNYSVTMTSAYGQVTSEGGELKFAGPTGVQFSGQPRAVTEYVGAPVTFEPDLFNLGVSYQWMKDGVALSDSPPRPLPSPPPPLPGDPVPAIPQGQHRETLPGVSGAREFRLRIGEITAADAGVYTLEISDGASTARSRGARLTVLPRPKPYVVNHPSHHTVVPGAIVSLEVFARSTVSVVTEDQRPFYDRPAYQWFKNGVSVPGATDARLAFYAKSADTGRYFARLTNPGGTTDSDVAEVVVDERASALMPVQWGNSYLVEGETRLFGVGMEVERRRFERTVDAVSWKIVGPPPSGNTARTPDFTPGLYVWVFRKGSVTEESRPFVQDYQPPIVPWMREHPQGRVAPEGSVVSLSASAVTYGPVTYQWQKDGVALPGQTLPSLTLTGFSAQKAGAYRVVCANALGSTTSEAAVVELRQPEPPVITEQPLGQTVVAGSPVTLRVSASGTSLRYQWRREGRPIVGATSASLSWGAVAIADSGAYSVTVSDGALSTQSRTAQLRVYTATRVPEFVIQPPAEVVAVLGADAVLSAGVDGVPLPDRYQWKKNGVDIPGATDAKLKLRDVTGDAAGAYSVVVTNSVGSVTSRAATLTVDARGRLVNLATRAAVGRDGDILIAGFVIGGTEPRQVLVRGIGDQLSEFGVGGVLRDPVVSLYDATGKLVDSNDDWFRLSEDKRTALEAAAKQVGAFAQRDDARDGALLATLAPGSYTVKVAGLANTTGVGLVEVYELGKPGTGRLVNLSSRAVVGTGANILIPGLVLNGQTPRRLLIRAVGPGLAEFGVAGTLGDPVMTVFRGSEEVARNDNWGEQPGAGSGGNAASVASIRTTMAAVGAFGLKDGSRDAVLLLDLPPGSYTVQVAGVAGATGVALVEVYEVGL